MMTMHVNQVQKNDFLNDLGDDFVAVNAAGHVVSRASTRASLEHATKNLGEPVHIFSAADFNPNGSGPEPTADEPIAQVPTSADASSTQQQNTDVEVKPTAKKAAPKK